MPETSSVNTEPKTDPIDFLIHPLFQVTNNVGERDGGRGRHGSDHEDKPGSEAHTNSDSAVLESLGMLASPGDRTPPGRRGGGPEPVGHAPPTQKHPQDNGKRKGSARIARSEYKAFRRSKRPSGTATASQPQTEDAIPAPEKGPDWEGSDNYGSSDDFARWISRHRRSLLVPESDIVPLTDFWDGKPNPPKQAVLKQGRCPVCGPGPEPGSLLYCPLCHRSGFEHQLAEQIRIVGYPVRIPKPSRRVSKAVMDKSSKVALQVAQKAHQAVPGITRKARRFAIFGSQPSQTS